MFSRKNRNKKNSNKVVPVNEKKYMNALKAERNNNMKRHTRRLGSVHREMKSVRNKKEARNRKNRTIHKRRLQSVHSQLEKRFRKTRPTSHIKGFSEYNNNSSNNNWGSGDEYEQWSGRQRWG